MNRNFVLKLAVICCISGALASFIYSRTGNKHLPHEKLMAYILDPENNLIKSDSMSNVTYSVFYKPAELINSHITGISKKDPASGQTLYFTLDCSFFNNDLLQNPNVPYDYTKVLTNLSFNLKDYIYAIADKKDTIHLKQSLYARNYGATNKSSVLLAFERRGEYETYEIFIRDFVFEKDEQIKLKFRSKYINDCPTLTQK